MEGVIYEIAEQPGKDGHERIVLAVGTEHEIELNFSMPQHQNDGNARTFRAIIYEIENIKKQIGKQNETV